MVVLALIGYFMAGQGARMKTAFWMAVGVLTLAWFDYLIVAGPRNKSQVFLFWSFCVTLAVVLLIAMGIDFVYLISFQHLEAGESFKKHMFESTFLNSSLAVAVISWAAVLAIFLFRLVQGLGLRNLLKQYVPAQDLLDDVTYRMIAIGWPLLTAGIITGAVWANSAPGHAPGLGPEEDVVADHLGTGVRHLSSREIRQGLERPPDGGHLRGGIHCRDLHVPWGESGALRAPFLRGDVINFTGPQSRLSLSPLSKRRPSVRCPAFCFASA